MADQEINEVVDTELRKYLAEIKRLVLNAPGRVAHVLNSFAVNGFSLAVLKDMIGKNIKEHENVVNAHGASLAQLGGMTKTEFDERMRSFFPKDGLPLSRIPKQTVSVADGSILLPTFFMSYYGRTVRVPGATLPVTSVKQYIVVTVTGQSTERTASLSVTTEPLEDAKKIIIGTVEPVDGALVAKMIEVIRIGYGAVSATPRGKGVPTSTGTPASAGSLPPGWTS